MMLVPHTAHRDDCHDRQGTKCASKDYSFVLLQGQQQSNEECLVA